MLDMISPVENEWIDACKLSEVTHLYVIVLYLVAIVTILLHTCGLFCILLCPADEQHKSPSCYLCLWDNDC